MSVARGFDVWAPRASTVELWLDGRLHRMRREVSDWWRTVDPVAWEPHVDYGYVIDGGDPVPDPRSLRQPSGVHGVSRTVDPLAFAWTDHEWAGRELAGGVIYELHVGTFTAAGTLDAAIERLDHLAELGVTFVELLPVNAVNGIHNWGYDGVLWFAVHEPYGGPEAYQRFVDACHARGLAVIQDVVYNHLGPSGNHLPRFGPYLGSGRSTWGQSINLDGEGSAEVRRYILDNAELWLADYHVDGLRLDAVHAMQDAGPRHLLAELSERVDALAERLGRPLTLIAESDLNDPVMITPRDAGGYGITAQWDDDYHHAAHVAVTGETHGYYEDFASLTALARVLRGGFFHAGTFSSFRGRIHGAPIDTNAIPAWRLVTFTQDHDQVGNRAAGDRPSQYLDEASLQLDAVLAVFTPFTPMLFMGQEWGASTPWQFFTSHPEPDLGRATAEGRLAEFERMGWDPDVVPDPQDPQTFTRSTLVWAEAGEGGHARLLDLYRRLIALRAATPEFAAGRFADRVEVDDEQRWLWFSVDGIVVALNFAAQPRVIPLPGAAAGVGAAAGAGAGAAADTDAAAELLLATADAVIRDTALHLPPRSAAIVRFGSPT